MGRRFQQTFLQRRKTANKHTKEIDTRNNYIVGGPHFRDEEPVVKTIQNTRN